MSGSSEERSVLLLLLLLVRRRVKERGMILEVRRSSDRPIYKQIRDSFRRSE